MSLPEGFDFVTQRELKMFGFIIYIKKKWLKPGMVTEPASSVLRRLSTQYSLGLLPILDSLV